MLNLNIFFQTPGHDPNNFLKVELSRVLWTTQYTTVEDTIIEGVEIWETVEIYNDSIVAKHVYAIVENIIIEETTVVVSAEFDRSETIQENGVELDTRDPDYNPESDNMEEPDADQRERSNMEMVLILIV